MAVPIFISYSSRHRDLTRALAAALEAQYGAGSVWWDEALEARGPYAEQIHAALQAARAVVVVWTRDATCSRWVYAEALAADNAGKLVHVRPSDVPADAVPLPFNGDQAEPPDAIDRILRAVDGVMTGRPLPTRVPLHEQFGREQGQPLLASRQARLPDDPFEISPSQLLQARYEQVGYLDATGLRQGLRDWAQGHPRHAAGRLLHGPGGVGKTRLLIDLAAEMRTVHGWAAGFVEHPPAQDDELLRRRRRQALRQLVELGDAPGLLLVLDYAEGRRDELLELAGWIEQRPDPARRPVRLVLLARGAGEWWQRIVDEQADVQAMFRERPDWPTVLELPPFASGEQRLALFEASCAAYGPVLARQGVALPAGAAPAPLRQRIADGTKRSRPLSIQMEALVWLAGGAASGTAGGVAELLDHVLGLERRHWARICGALDEAATTELERGLAQLTLVQGVPELDAAGLLLQRDAYYGGRRQHPVDRAPLLSRLARLYGDGGTGLLPLEPDLLGEHLVARATDERLLDACIGWIDAGTDGSADNVMGQLQAAGRREHLVTVLQRATAPEHGAAAQARVGWAIDRLLSAHLARWAPAVVTTLLETPGAILSRLTDRLPVLDPPSLEALDEALPLRTVALDRLALGVAQRRLDLERAHVGADMAGDPARAARLANRVGTLGLRLAGMGQRENALSATEEAVRIYRQLDDVLPDTFGPALATGLNNLCSDLADLGRHEEALAAADEAVQIRRRLVQAEPGTYRPYLAMSLNNLGNSLSALDRHEDALVAADEAAQIYRELAKSRPEAFTPDLATSLNNLGIKLSALGRHDDALSAIDEAMQLRRLLAQTSPDEFLPDLASSLNNLGNRLSSLGRCEGALAVTDEAIQIRRGLAQARPDVFTPDLARSLGARSMALAGIGRHAEAAASAEEGLTLLLPMVRRYPEALRPLAMSLANDHLREAEAAVQEPNASLLMEIAVILGLDLHGDPQTSAPS